MSIPPRILVVDDHPTFAMGMISILRKRWPKARIESVTSHLAAKQALEQGWDLVVLDHHLGDQDGLTLVAEAVAKEVKTLVVSMADATADQEIARSRGASGWIRKDCDPEAMVRAIACVLEGNLLWEDRHAELSPRERSVLEGIAARVPLKQLAIQLGVSYSTLNTYRRRITRKLDLGGKD